MNLSVTVWEGVSYFPAFYSYLTSTFNAAAVHVLILTPRVLLVPLSHGWESLPLRAACRRNILITPVNVSITSQWLPFVGCSVYNRPNIPTNAQFPPDRTQQKIVSHSKMNSPSYNRTALRPIVFLTGNTLITSHNN